MILIKWLYRFFRGENTGTVVALSGIEYRILVKAIQEDSAIGYVPEWHSPILNFFGLYQSPLKRLLEAGYLRQTLDWDVYTITNDGKRVIWDDCNNQC